MKEDAKNKTTDQTEPKLVEGFLTEAARSGFYTNLALIQHSELEFIITFILQFPSDAVVQARVVMSPHHAKRLARALTENVAKYEEKFGEIIIKETT